MSDAKDGLMTADMERAFRSLYRKSGNLFQAHDILKVDVDYAFKKWTETILELEDADITQHTGGYDGGGDRARLNAYRQAVKEWDEGGREKISGVILWA